MEGGWKIIENGEVVGFYSCDDAVRDVRVMTQYVDIPVNPRSPATRPHVLEFV